ncbi:MAG: heavy-metal-associated domain-containing protein [Rhodobacteraceae bacterium]|nr:heavy-metal-associated domain-containing protein [Paracoccaceae bacterium]
MKLSIPDMSCGHCENAIRRALTSLDASARLQVDFASHSAELATSAPSAAVLAALEAEGYPSRLIE